MTMRARLGPIVVGALLLACSSDPKASPKGDDPKHEAPPSEPRQGLGDEPLHNGQPSLAALGEGIVAALQANDGRALMALAVTQTEFERRLFGALVLDAHDRRGGVGPAWKSLSSESLPDMTKALSQHGGKGYTFVSLESTKQDTRPGGLVVHDEPRLTVADASGAPLELKILGQVLEHPASGTFLVLTFRD